MHVYLKKYCYDVLIFFDSKQIMLHYIRITTTSTVHIFMLPSGESGKNLEEI